MFFTIKFLYFFILTPILNAPAIVQCSKNVTKEYALLISLLLFPAINAFILAALYMLNLKASDFFYIGTLLVVNMMPFFIILMKSPKSLHNFFGHFFNSGQEHSVKIIFFLNQDNKSKKKITYIKDFLKFLFKQIISIAQNNDYFKAPAIAFVLSIALISIYFIPLNVDILEYMEIGKIFYREKSLIYPIQPFYKENLFASHSTHPPFFTLLMSFCYLLQGGYDCSFLPNLFHGFYVGMFLLILLYIMKKHLFAAMLLISVGLFTSQYAVNSYFLPTGIDTFRLAYFLFTFSLLQKLMKHQNSTSILVLLGIFCGFSLATHSSGLLFLILFIPVFLCCFGELSKFKNLAIILFIALIIGGWQYGINIYKFGKPISDDVLLWSKFHYQEYMRYERGLYSTKEIFDKFLKVFEPSCSQYGGAIPILFITLLVNAKFIVLEFRSAFYNFFCIKNKTHAINIFTPYLFFIFGFYCVVFLSILANQDLLIKNYRYLLTPYTFALVSFYGIFFCQLEKILYCFFSLSRFLLSIKGLLCVIAVISATYLGLDIHKKNKNDSLYFSTADIEKYLKFNLKSSNVIFAFERAGLYEKLPDTKINFYLNDNSAYFFEIDDIHRLVDELQKNNIRYIFTSGYRPFILNKSLFYELLANPKLSTIVQCTKYYQLYELKNSKKSEDQKTRIIKHVTIKEKDSSTISLKLKQGTEYIFKINQLTRNVFYDMSIVSHPGGETYAKFTHNKSTKIRIKTPIKQTDDPFFVNLFASSKDLPLDLAIEVSELK